MRGAKSNAGAGVPRPLSSTIDCPALPFPGVRTTLRAPWLVWTLCPYGLIAARSAWLRARLVTVEVKRTATTTAAVTPRVRSRRRGLWFRMAVVGGGEGRKLGMG